jgi:hypothetical protein
MFSSTRSTLAVAVAATILGASPALAMPPASGTGLGGENAVSRSISSDLRGEHAAALSETRGQNPETRSATGADLRGENAIGASDPVTPPAGDQRSPDAREPVGGQGVPQPVVVEVTDPSGSGFDWTAAIIGMAGGLALAVLAGVAVAGSRRRPRTAV